MDSTPGKALYDDEVNLLEYLRVLGKNRRLIGCLAAGAFVVSLVLSLVLPKVYESTASIMPPGNEGANPLSLAVQSSGGGFGGVVGGLLGGTSQTVLWVGMLNSRSVRDRVIDKFGLKELYGRKTMDGTRRAFDKHVKVQVSSEGMILLTVEDHDPERASAMANSLIEELDRVLRGMNMNAGQRARRFLAERLDGASRDLSGAEAALQKFQEKTKVIRLDEQSRAIIEAIGSLKGQLTAKEVALETALTYATPENPQVQILKAEIAGLREKMREMDAGAAKGARGMAAGGKDVFIPTGEIPDLAFRYAELYREVKVQEKLYELLTQQYELARIMEAKDSPTVQVLDPAVAPQIHSKPRKFFMVFFSTLCAGIAGVLFSFGRELFSVSRRSK